MISLFLSLMRGTMQPSYGHIRLSQSALPLSFGSFWLDIKTHPDPRPVRLLLIVCEE